MKNRIITPIKTETVGRSPCFIGSLVSSDITTIIADTSIKEISLFIPAQTFYNYKSISNMPPNTLLLL